LIFFIDASFLMKYSIIQRKTPNSRKREADVKVMAEEW
jgi:hypothetical protein